MPKYNNQERLSRIKEKDWREALDEPTSYLTWRLKGNTRYGAHSERELQTPALDYYTEEAVSRLIQGVWKWQGKPPMNHV